MEEQALVKYLQQWHARSRGYDADPPAVLFPRIIVGPPHYLTPAFVKKTEITHIINCAEPGLTPTWLVRHAGPSGYAHIPTDDHPNYPIVRGAYPRFEQIMTRFLRDPSCRNVYVHCAAGVNRSATLAHAYVSKQFGVPLPRLVEHSMPQRPCMLQNPGFIYQLYYFTKKHD
jgi:protein-tyrosine phosphatase